jgi:hypothetical protein
MMDVTKENSLVKRQPFFLLLTALTPLLMRCRDTVGTPDFMHDLLAVPVHYPQPEMGGAPVGTDEKFHCTAFI